MMTTAAGSHAGGLTCGDGGRGCDADGRYLMAAGRRLLRVRLEATMALHPGGADQVSIEP